MPKRKRGAVAAQAKARKKTTKKAAKAEQAEPAKDTSDDTVKRCDWATHYTGAISEAYIEYHDKEWGRPCYEDNKLFEMLTLEGAQAGLSWATILNKRAAYQEAFSNFDPKLVAEFTDGQINELLQPNSGIVKNRKKVLSTVNNAKCVLEVQEEFGTFQEFIWGFVPNGEPIINNWTTMSQVPAKTPEAENMSKELKKRGFGFVGPTTCYAFMQAVGMVNDHTVDCFCRDEILPAVEQGKK